MSGMNIAAPSIVERLGEGRVVCLGDIMLDRFVSGTVDRVSPEAPVPVCRVLEQSVMLGGVGNVARNLAALNVTTTVIATVGDDGPAREIADLTARLPLLSTRLTTEPGRVTTVKTRFSAQGHQLLRADHETTTAISDATRSAILQRLDQSLTENTVLLISDYGKGTLTRSLLRDAIHLARGRNNLIIVDPKGDDFGRYAGATILTPNAKELALATQRTVKSDADVEAASREIIHRCGVDAVMCTRGPDGLSLVSAIAAVHVPATAREVFDVSGAGDTVAAVMAACLAVGVPAPEAAAIANTAGGIVVGKTGTSVVLPEELQAALRNADLLSEEHKIVSVQTALERVAAWRRKGYEIGFTNGCFDLIHPGHVTLLRRARMSCGRLVVGLNTDASVRRLKGPTRPIQSEGARAVILSSLASVDMVVLFDEDTPQALIEQLKPDVLVKGADYALEQVVGAEFVQTYGGRVQLIDLTPAASTTQTIARITQGVRASG